MALEFARLLRHLFAPSARRLFPAETLQAITTAIAEGEARHRGELCFAVEPALPLHRIWAGIDPRQRAAEVFAQLRVWDTQANNGVLLYLLLADHRIEIVADRGLQGRVSDAQWRGICQPMEERLRAGDARAAVVAAVAQASELLVAQFPRVPGDHDDNELPDRPHLL